MTDHLSPLAVQNATVLRALVSAPYATLSALATAADVAASNLNRKLASLESEGLIEKVGEASHQVALTAKARRALDAIAVYEGGLPASAPSGETVIPLAQIGLGPLNPRGNAEAYEIEELAQSIADKGVLQPILLRPAFSRDDGARYEVVVGERRFRAARHAVEQGWLDADFAMPARIRELTDDEAFEIAGVENLQRADMHWMDEAEFYLSLAERGRSAAQIIRLVGNGARKKRSIQELTQFARELDDTAKARARLPEGDPARLSIDQCRALVGNKRERPALNLSPKLALAMLEIIHAGDGERTRLYRKPVGGAITTLSDRGLIKMIVERGEIFALIPENDDLTAWLRQTGYNADPALAVFNAQADVVGDLEAVEFAAHETFVTRELNPVIETEPQPMEGSGWEDDDAAGETEGDAAARKAKLLSLTAPVELALIEIAHKIQNDPAHEDNSTTHCAVDGFSKLAQDMIYDGLILFHIQAASRRVSLTRKALDWFKIKGTVKLGRAVVSVETLSYNQIRLRGDAPPSGHLYWTPWLNPSTAPHPAPAADAPVTQAPAQSPAHVVRDFADQVREAAGGEVPAAILERLMRVAVIARGVIEAATSRKLKPEEAQTHVAMIDAVIGDAERALAKASQS